MDAEDHRVRRPPAERPGQAGLAGEGKEDADVGDEQFEINDDRSFEKMYEDMEHGGLQPVLNDYIYV